WVTACRPEAPGAAPDNWRPRVRACAGPAPTPLNPPNGNCDGSPTGTSVNCSRSACLTCVVIRPACAGVTVPATGSKVIFESLDDGLISSRRPEAACTIRMLNVAATLPCTGAGSDGVPGAGR